MPSATDSMPQMKQVARVFVILGLGLWALFGLTHGLAHLLRRGSVIVARDRLLLDVASLGIATLSAVGGTALWFGRAWSKVLLLPLCGLGLVLIPFAVIRSVPGFAHLVINFANVNLLHLLAAVLISLGAAGLCLATWAWLAVAARDLYRLGRAPISTGQ